MRPTARIRRGDISTSTPTETSPIYAASIALASDTTIKARAFEDGWTPSAVMQDAYQVDSVPPTMVTTVSPAPNAIGWNNSAVTATFVCADATSAVVSCPPPVRFDVDGANQRVTVTARDEVGNEATATVMVNLESTPIPTDSSRLFEH